MLTNEENIFIMTNMYSELFRLQANLLKVLAQPKRLEIIHLLRDQRLNVTEIYSMLDLPQANVSQHLMVMREAGIVTAEREGKAIYYSLANPKIIEASDAIREWLLEQHQAKSDADELILSMKDLLPIVTDPVCSMRLSPKTAGFSTVYNGETIYFCASGCHKLFIKNPKKYVG